MCIRLYLVKPAQRLSQLIFLVLSVAASHVMAEQASKINEEAMRSEFTTCVDNVSYKDIEKNIAQNLVSCSTDVLLECYKSDVDTPNHCIDIVIETLKAINKNLLVSLKKEPSQAHYQELPKACNKSDRQVDLGCILIADLALLMELSVELNALKVKKTAIAKP